MNWGVCFGRLAIDAASEIFRKQNVRGHCDFVRFQDQLYVLNKLIVHCHRVCGIVDGV